MPSLSNYQKINGKAILTGEYALMHGAGAIAFPTQGAITCHHRPQPTNAITIDSDEGISKLSWQQLANHAKKLQHQYQRFLNQHIPINQVLTQPNDIIILAIFLASQLPPQQINLAAKGFSLKLTSTLPIGSGMGSSAAVTSAVLHCLLPQMPPNNILQLVKQCENYAHGKSGDLDAWMSIYSKSVWWYDQQAYPLTIHTEKFHFLHTGKPQASTAECVEQVNKQFHNQHPIWQQFKQLSQEFKDYFNECTNQQSAQLLNKLITSNHQLLTNLGVVPTTTQQLITDIQQVGGAAKTIGSGSIRGKQAGVILVHNISQQKLKLIANQHQVIPIY